MELTLKKCLKDYVELVHISKRLLNSLIMSISDISPLVQLTLVLHLEHQCTFTYHFSVKRNKFSNLLQINTTFKLEVLMVSILKLMITFTIFRTKEDLEEVRHNLYKICMTE